MVITFTPQKFRAQVNTNTNYPPQRFDESGSTPPPVSGNMEYEDFVTMAYEDGIDMEYEQQNGILAKLLISLNRVIRYFRYNKIFHRSH